MSRTKATCSVNVSVFTKSKLAFSRMSGVRCARQVEKDLETRE
jgi:hypothetical protein